MSEEFWLGFWKIAGAVVVVFLLCTTGSCVNKQYVLRDMVLEGVDPMVASCAVYNGEVDQVNCVAYYATHK